MPESRQRKKADFIPPTAGAARAARLRARRWVAPAMVACWLLGLAWIVVFYLAPNLKYMSTLGNWNLAIGMVLIAGGFVLSTKWQ